MNEQEQLIHDAWRDSEAYAVPMTEEGEKLTLMRWHGFKRGWKYAEFYAKTGSIYMKDYDEQNYN